MVGKREKEILQQARGQHIVNDKAIEAQRIQRAVKGAERAERNKSGG